MLWETTRVPFTKIKRNYTFSLPVFVNKSKVLYIGCDYGNAVTFSGTGSKSPLEVHYMLTSSVE